MSAPTLKNAYRFVFFLLVLLPYPPDQVSKFFLSHGGNRGTFCVLASRPVLGSLQADEKGAADGKSGALGRRPVHRSMLKAVGQHRPGFVSLGEKTSSLSTSGTQRGTQTAVQCTIQFEGPPSEPPTVQIGAAPPGAGPFLTIFRDTDPVARGWIHGFQKGVIGEATFRLGASQAGHGEYAQVHPPSGTHIYELLIFDKDYSLGPTLAALVGTPWQNQNRAMGPETALLVDIQTGNPHSNPQIIGRCSVSVSHEQVASFAQEDM